MQEIMTSKRVFLKCRMRRYQEIALLYRVIVRVQLPVEWTTIISPERQYSKNWCSVTWLLICKVPKIGFQISKRDKVVFIIGVPI